MLNVVHSLPGRTRIHIESSLAPTIIECFIRSLPSIYSATYTKETRNVLIYHNPALSLRTIKQSIRPLCVKKKEDEVHLFSWRKLLPVVACGAMFLANWYIQNSPFSPIVKNTGH